MSYTKKFTINIKASKVVCEEEQYLPNWGPADPITGEPNAITETTAIDYLDYINDLNEREVCWLENEWDFQWGYDDKDYQYGVDLLPGDLIGEADGTDTTGMCVDPYCGPNTYTGINYENWKTFGPSNGDGIATLHVADLDGAEGFWVREVLKDGYIPYSHPPKEPEEDDVSAELYCQTDIVNYDNYDLIEDAEFGETYYCVAFNALEEECDGVIEGRKFNELLMETSGEVIEGWLIELYDADEVLLNSTTTDSNGYYYFDGLCDGDYIVKEEMPEGWKQIYPFETTGYDYYNVTLETLPPGAISFKKENGFRNQPMICGHKYDSGNDNAPIEGWRIDISETTGTSCDGDECMSAIAWVASTTTDSEGEYCFEVYPGLYQISEELRDGWIVDGESSYIEEFTGESSLLNIDFYNYEEGDDNSYCGDGTCDDDEDEESCCEDCGTCTFRSSSSGGTVLLRILDEEVHCIDEDSVELTWRTNYNSTRQVVYGNTSNPGGIAPTYGYDFSTEEDLNVSRSHSVIIDGLDVDTYYFKAISGSAKGEELALDMGTCQIVVKGEEGAPVLEITKEADKDFANPGDEIEFTITVENTGNLTAYAVVLKDMLPEELEFVEFIGDEKSWDLGDLEPGDSKEIKVKTIVSDSASAGVYVNNTEVSAVNYSIVKASDDYEVQEIAVLAETGFDINELFTILLSLLALMASSLFLRRKLS